MIAGLLLAAGHSTRFGSNKLLHAPPGSPPLALQAARCLAPLEQSLAVIPRGDDTLRTLFQDIGLAVVEVQEKEGSSGLSSSLRSGLLATPQADGWIIALADMPQVKVSTVVAMQKALSGGALIVACRYRGQRGNPVGFSSHFREALMTLRGDQGARRLLDIQRQDVCWLDVDDPGILLDIDVPTDWPHQEGQVTSEP